MIDPPAATLRNLVALTKRQAFAEAEDLGLRVTKQYPQAATGWFLLAHVRRQRQDIAGARATVRQGLSVAPTDKRLRLLSVELALKDGETALALENLRALAADTRRDGVLLQKLGYLFTRLNLHEEAERCHRRALETEPGNLEFLYDLAIPVIALGQMDRAEAILDRLIAVAPQNYNAYFLRATLRKQTPSRNHVAQLEGLSSKPLSSAMGEVELCYALAKELEDLGEYRRSFAALKRGASARRRMLSYRVEDDMRSMEKIAEIFNSDFFGRHIAGKKDAKPIFVVGLPRSGTTLIDRILSSHSQVESVGEISAFHDAMARAVQSATNKFDIGAVVHVDFARIGQSYVEMTPRITDKTPTNFLYAGIIARAFPGATIIHLKRDAMDVCYAMYKTLLQNFPFTFELSDIARYYLAYRKLMAHWNKVLPGRIVEVRYEDVVASQEGVTRRLIADCGLDWEDACLAPERNAGASLTASAAQVRQKVYNSSVGLWRAYEEELQPLVRILREGGVEIDCA
jgi:tetratricopeptide (TPR) repeat protein